MNMSQESSKSSNIDPKLLAILCCPETKQHVTLLDDSRLENLNQKIEAGELQNKIGAVIREKLDGALIRSDQRIAYPIREGIPIMLIDEGIPLHNPT